MCFINEGMFLLFLFMGHLKNIYSLPSIILDVLFVIQFLFSFVFLGFQIKYFRILQTKEPISKDIIMGELRIKKRADKIDFDIKESALYDPHVNKNLIEQFKL